MAHGAAAIRGLSAIVLATLLAACGSAPKDSAPSAAALAADLKGSPPPLASLHARADRLLGGGPSALRAQLKALRGYPVVVTQWASWCGPCRSEFPIFQQLSARLGRRVAFIGDDVDDSSGDARNWLASFPVSFPSFRDPDGTVAMVLSQVFAQRTPVTYLYTRTGKQYFHVGPYLSERSLRQEIHRYLGV